jgi:16S rRNA processing protein RimM
MSSSSKTEPTEILVGEVLRAHGVRGEVVVASHTERPERFAPGSALRWVPGGGAARTLVVERARAHRSGWLVAFVGVSGRDAAEQLAGASLMVPREAVPEAPAGSFYPFELIGCRASDRREGDLGEVVDLIADGGGWLVAVEREDGFRLAIPFVERFVARIDREARRIEWELPEGLIEACASRS